ncbi:hypothetical protein H0H81_009200 [Sphagnurus paluster]|uniref:Uncharacterized protein n=1 Tax=Sphagnurus paluster TaxID=117069 RepID=A0A9P7FRR3_9AGAR|nr:hypothetical protein H0H81_009200 [Sphagnurus paluster]
MADKKLEPGKQYPFGRRSEGQDPWKLPRAADVFDKLLKKSRHEDHANNINSLVAALACVISRGQLSLHRVDENRLEYNQTSPFLDLSPLYGTNKSESDTVRAKDGTGMLSPDCYYDIRATFLPPAVSALLILWNRNHNYIARHLLLNNERKEWKEPSDPNLENGITPPWLLAQDDQIFEIARAINCVQFMNVVVEDFLKILCGLSHTGPGSNLNILAVVKDLAQVAKGKGHTSTVEFSLLHSEWSSLFSQKDVQAFKEKMAVFSGNRPENISDMMPREFNELLHQTTSKNPNRRQWNLADIRRGSNSRFKDQDLAHILYEATERAAGAVGARCIDSCFRSKELIMLERARKWKVGSLNQFRKFLGLKPLKSFEEWNSNPDVASAAKSLYGDSIDALELYVRCGTSSCAQLLIVPLAWSTG